MESKRLLFVTGGTGFLGGHFIRAAIRDGHTVIALRRRGSSPRVPITDQVEWVEDDSETSLRSVCRPEMVFVHFLAAGVTPQKVTWQQATDINLLMSVRLWESAAACGVQRYVIAGTASEYGNSCFRFQPVPPDAPLEPVGPYACTKAAASIYARSFAAEKKVELAYIRVFSLYGEGQHFENLYPSLCRAARSGNDFPMTNGEQVRDFSPVEEAAQFFLMQAIKSPLASGRATFMNYGSGKPIRVIDQARKWWKELKATGNLLVGALPSRTHEALSIVPLVSKKI